MSADLTAADLLAIWAALMSSRAPGRVRLMHLVYAAYEATTPDTDPEREETRP